MLDATGPLEVFAGANAYASQATPGHATYRIITASPGGVPVRTSSGLALVPDTDLSDVPAPHTVLIPGCAVGPRGVFVPDPDVVAWLRRHAPKCRRVVSVCTGAFALAEAGLLSGRKAVTHWSAADRLAATYPDVKVDPEPIFVRDGRISTSAGVTSGIDLALALVEEDLGRDTALTIARYLVVFLRRPGNQKQFSTQLEGQLAQRPPLREVQQWITDNPAADLSIQTLARHAGFSPRHFTRAFTAETGTSPGRYVEQTRLETARRLLEDTHDSIEQITRTSGYPTPEAMRRAFQRALGIPPSQYRQRF